MRRVLSFAVAATLLAAGPVLAQAADPIVGRYAMTVEPEAGSLCAAAQATVEILSVNGSQIDVDFDHVRFTGEYNPDQQTFVGHIPFPDADHQIRLDGGFSRGPGVTNLIITVEFPPNQPCKALLSGTIPANGSPTPPAPALGSTPSVPVSSGPPIFGVAPNDAPVDLGPVSAPPPAGMGPIRDGKLLGGIGLLAFLLGIGIRILRRPKTAATPAPAAAPPPVAPPPPAGSPEPEVEADAAEAAPPKARPARKPAKRKAKTPRTEEEDELGDG